MTHTFLLEEGFWKAQGTFYDEWGAGYSADGQSLISHSSDLWVLESIMRVFRDEPIMIANRYEIEPLRDGSRFAHWISRNQMLGILKGKLAIVEDTILSFFQSEEGPFGGTEYLQKVDDDTYRNRKVMFKGNRILACWSVELKKAG